jgi:BASS family bile acid:Na+ symporter
MLGMGLSLTIQDFRNVVKYPKAFAIGIVNQLILLPIIGFLLLFVFKMDPILSVGFMLLAACPGGVTSNLISHVAKADTALSISLTAVTSFVTVITIPLIVNFALGYFMSENQEIQLPLVKTIVQIIGITVLPVSIGMFVRKRAPEFSNRMEKPARTASTVIFVLIFLGIVFTNLDVLQENIGKLGLATLTLNVITMLTGYFIAKALQLNLPQTLSISIESGIQNGTLAIVIASSILQNADMSLPAAIYSLPMFLTGGIMMYYFGKRKAVND